MACTTFLQQPVLHRNYEHHKRCAVRSQDGVQCDCTVYKYAGKLPNGWDVCKCGHEEAAHGFLGGR
jgi:hypothetical protein